jgi:hypothetical protein
LKWKSDEPLSGIGDIIDYQLNMYQQWSGRVTAHTIVQLLFLIGKPWSSLLTTSVYFLTAHLICHTAKIKQCSVYFMVLAALYYLNPAFTETVLWFTGTANYLWTAMIVLVAIQPFMKLLRDEPLKRTDWFYIPVCFLAGWCNENISTTMALFMLVCVLIAYQKNHHFSFQAVILLLFAVCGCVLLILAPGNFARSHGFDSGLLSIAYRGYGQVKTWFTWLFPVWLLYVVFRYMLYRKKIQVPQEVKLLAYWSVLSILVMLASPSYPERATFGSLVILLIAIVIMIRELYFEYERLFVCVGVLCMIGLCGSFLSIGLLQAVRNSGVEIPG